MSSPAAAAPAMPAPTIEIKPGMARLPWLLIILGGLGALIGLLVPSLHRQFAFSWLLAFMFYLSLALGALFLVILHHLFDAQWSVPIRRVNEHIACSFPVLAVLFVPILINALFSSEANALYAWMHADPAHDHALKAKQPMFTKPAFVLISLALLAIWWLLSTALRRASLEQDRTGAASCTRRMRVLSAGGIFAFALTLSLGAILWMKALQHQWFSTMYGVYYFSACVWVTVATVYLLTAGLQRLGPLAPVVRRGTFHDLATVFFAFTVFNAYVHFSQYFLIWNANMPEETFWYVLRERGSWWSIGLLLIFGHFFLPFLLLLRVDTKVSLTVMIPLGLWAWAMHYCDLAFNIVPVVSPEGFQIHWLDVACMALMGGVLVLWFIRNFTAHPPFPQRDPRMAEALGIHLVPAEHVGGGR